MSLSQLPDELIFMICEKLTSVVDLVNLSVCSKRINLLCKDFNRRDVYDIKNEENINPALSFNKNIKLKLDLSEKDISDFSKLGNVYNLNLYICYNILDVSMLGNVHTLNLSGCEITEVSMLGNVHTLNLSGMEITDVSMLGNVHTLDLSYCDNVTDVSMLVNVYTLKISGHNNISDFSMLNNCSYTY